MKSRNAERQIRKLQRNIHELNLDLKDIQSEHEKYRLDGTEEEVENWFKALPIENLKDSLEMDRGLPSRKYTLTDLRHRFGLARLYQKTLERKEASERQLRIAKIDALLQRINWIQGDDND